MPKSPNPTTTSPSTPPPPYTTADPHDASPPLTIPHTIAGLQAFHALPPSPAKTNAILHELLDLSETFSSLSDIIAATNNAGRAAGTQEPLLQILNMRLALKRIGAVANLAMGREGPGDREEGVGMAEIRRVEVPRVAVYRGWMRGVYWVAAREFGRGVLRARRLR